MVRQAMKVVLYLVALLVCFGAKSSKADWRKEKRKFVSISNKAKSDALIQCNQNLNKTVKPGEKIRWGVPKKAEETMICHVDMGGKAHGYMSMFVEEECKKECKWRVFDGGVLKLKLRGGEWKSFEVMADEESAKSYNVPPTKKNEGPSPSPKNKWTKFGSPRIQTNQNKKESAPAPAPAPAPKSRRKLKPRNPRSGMLAPMNDNRNMTPPIKHAKATSDSGAPSPTTHSQKWRHGNFPKREASAPAPAPANWKQMPASLPPQDGKHKVGAPPPLKQTPEQGELPPPGSTFLHLY